MRWRLRPARITAMLVAALSVSVWACGGAEREPCTQADLDRPAPTGMPTPVRIAQTRRLNDEPLEPLPATMEPQVSATQAWQRFREVRARSGGGTDEFLLGVFTDRARGPVPAWALYTTHLAAPLAPLKPRPGVTTPPNTDVCVFVDVLTVLNADTGERFHFKTVTSTARRGASPPAQTERPPLQEPPPISSSPPQ